MCASPQDQVKVASSNGRSIKTRSCINAEKSLMGFVLLVQFNLSFSCLNTLKSPGRPNGPP